MRPVITSLFAASLLALAAGGLAACSPEAPGGGEAVPPADAPAGTEVLQPAGTPGEPQPTTATDPAAPFRQDFVAMGTEPFWRLDVKGTSLVLTRPDEPAVTGGGADLVASSGKAVWTAQAGTETLVATLSAGTCSDGMSDRTYPYTAEVRLGAAVLKGCGISAGDFAKLAPR